MFPFSFWNSTGEFESRLQATELTLLDFAQRNAKNSVELTALDTDIPRSSIPCLEPTEEDDTLKIHSIRGVSKDLANAETFPFPLVNLHGYMNAGAYFYQNVCDLCTHYPSVYGVDMLGWGQSTRVPFHEVKDNGSVESAEDFFVESLEAWRSANNIEKMVLSGHSFGGYVGVAYAERYPERVDRLILLSPFGVPDPMDPNVRDRFDRVRASFRGKVFLGIFQTMFDWTTPGAVIRSFTEHRGSLFARSYVERRLPGITNQEESQALADFLYLNAVLPPSGEFFLRSLFTRDFCAKKPLFFRIPSLKVESVNFMYGTTDWMDVSGGMYTQTLNHKLSQQLHRDGSSLSTTDINVYLVPNAGHLLILQNPTIVNACMIRIGGGRVNIPEAYMPELLDLDKHRQMDESWVTRAREILEEREQRMIA